ncbi:MAG: hypothetical protein SF162_12565 [bacterium]|nr:hypothetical protein [bacterium]
MVNWHVISDVGTVQSGIGAASVLGCPYLFVAGRNQAAPEETAAAERGGRVWIGIPQDGNLFSETRWKWNMRWEPLFASREDLMTDTAPAVGTAWGTPVVFIKSAGEGRIFYTSYELGEASPWREVGGVTDQPLSATGVTFNGRSYLYLFRRNPVDGQIYYTRTGDKGETKTWETWRAIPGDLRTKKAPAAATLAAPNGRMLCLFAKRENNRIAFTGSLDGIKWSAWKDVTVNGAPIETLARFSPTAATWQDSIYLPFIPPNMETTVVRAAVLSPVVEGDRVVNASWSVIDLCPIPTDFDHGIVLNGYRNSEASYLFAMFHATAGNAAVVSRAETVKPVFK